MGRSRLGRKPRFTPWRQSLLVLACLAGQAWAHDTWLAQDGTGWRLLTGSRYPVADAGAAKARPTCVSRGGVRSCWTSLADHTIEIEPPLVDVYLREIRAPQGVHDAWAAMKDAGVTWRETYRKFARVETGTATAPAALRAARKPVGAGLEIVVAGDAPVRAGEPLAMQVLAAGRPVPGLAVELVSDRSPLGVWLRSDAQGRLQSPLPFAGAWLARATLLERDGAQWRSRFATLLVEAR